MKVESIKDKAIIRTAPVRPTMPGADWVLLAITMAVLGVVGIAQAMPTGASRATTAISTGIDHA